MLFCRRPVIAGLEVTNLIASQHFYQDQLRFVVAHGGDNDSVVLRKRNQFIRLKQADREGTGKADLEVPESPRGFDATLRRLEAANVQIELEKSQASAWTTELAATFLDQDGNRITLTTRKIHLRLPIVVWPGRWPPVPIQDGNRITLTMRKIHLRLPIVVWPGRWSPVPIPVIVPVSLGVTAVLGVTINVFAGSHASKATKPISVEPIRRPARGLPIDDLPLVKVREIPLRFPEFDVFIYVLDDGLKWRFTKTGEFENGSLAILRERVSEIARKRNLSEIVCVGTASIEGESAVESIRAGNRLDTLHDTCRQIWTTVGKDVQAHRLNLGKFQDGPMPPPGTYGTTTGHQRRAVILGIRRKKQVSDLGKQLQLRLTEYKDGAVALPFQIDQYAAFIFDGRDLTAKGVASR